MAKGSDQSGDKNPNWKGGHRHWSAGRFGKDKDGLSWKAQRKLAWERDGYTCQHCGEKRQRNPDVHHKVPFRVSLSHHLDNLICLCQKCHLTEEAKIQDQWGGQLVEPRRRSSVGRPRPKNPLYYCSVCGGRSSERRSAGYVCMACLKSQGLPKPGTFQKGRPSPHSSPFTLLAQDPTAPRCQRCNSARPLTDGTCCSCAKVLTRQATLRSLLASGHSRKEIEVEMGISPTTYWRLMNDVITRGAADSHTF